MKELLVDLAPRTSPLKRERKSGNTMN